MKKMSIKWKMTLSFSIISAFVILSCLLIAYINSNSTANIFFNHFEQTKNEFSLVTIQTEATLKGNLQIIDENINQNFDLFFNKTESLLNSMVNSRELDILAEHNQLSKGNVSSSPYMNLPQWNNSQVNYSLNPFLENIVKSYNEIQLAYVTTPDKATYIGPTPNTNLYDFDGTQRIWYTEAIKSNGIPYWTDAYIDKVSNKPITTLSEVVKRNNKIVGVVGLDVSLDALSQIVSQTKIGKTGYSLLTDKNGLILADANDNSLVGQTIQSKFSQLKPIFDGSQGFFEYTANKTDILVHYATNKSTGWKIITTIEKNDLLSSATSLKDMENKNDIALNNAQQQNKMMIVSLLIIGTLGLVIVFAGSFSLSKTISKKLDSLQSSIYKVSNGDLSEELPFKDGDEIDNLSNQFKSMTEQLRSLILSNKQLSSKIESSATNLASFTEEAASQTQEVSSHVKQVANLTEEQANQTREASEIAQSFSKAIQKVNDTTEVVKKLVENASIKEKEGTVSVLNLEQASNENLVVSERVFANIKDLIEQIKRVSSFTLMIKSISEQTNLLSLNAAIEAARAGEHGKGFAVVADEVKKLAVESSQTASKIENIINSIEKQTVISVENLSKTEQIVKSQHDMVNQTRSSFSNIQDSIQDVLYQMNEVSQVMEDINQGKEKFVKAINTINELSQSTASSYHNIALTSEEQVIAIEDLNIATQALAEMADKLNKEVNRFTI